MKLKILIRLFVKFAIIFLILPSLMFAQQKTTGKPTHIFGISGVNEEDSRETEPNASVGGGMEMQRYFATYLYDKLQPCGFNVHEVSVAWVKKHRLIISFDQASSDKVKLQIWKPDYNGIFELNYVSREDGSHARVWMDYYSITGEIIAPEAIPELFNKYEIANLWDQLREAFQCSKPQKR